MKSPDVDGCLSEQTQRDLVGVAVLRGERRARGERDMRTHDGVTTQEVY